jgi:hypothetical protein
MCTQDYHAQRKLKDNTRLKIPYMKEHALLDKLLLCQMKSVTNFHCGPMVSFCAGSRCTSPQISLLNYIYILIQIHPWIFGANPNRPEMVCVPKHRTVSPEQKLFLDKVRGGQLQLEKTL